MNQIPGRFEQIATRVAFLMAGLAMASWAPLVPLAKARIGLDEGQLGSLLLCLGLGSVICMPFSGGWAAKFGCRRTILTAGAFTLGALPFMATASSAASLAASLLVFGASIGTIDVTMNIQAVLVEKASNRPMMSGFHGLFSAGGICGAGAVTGLMSVGFLPLQATLTVSVTAAFMLIFVRKGLLSYGSEEEAAAFAVPRGFVLLLGALCFIMFLAEGSVLDWSAVILAKIHKVATNQAGFGYVAFSIAMTTGRLLGDIIVSRLGAFRILVLGGVCAATGFAIAAFVPSPFAALVGFALVGIGASNVVPVLFTAAGNQKVMPTNLAVASVTTMGYAGILMGPAIIGYVATWTTLKSAILVVSVLLVIVAMSARKVTSVMRPDSD